VPVIGPIKRQIMALVLAGCFAGAATRGMADSLSAANDIADTAMSAKPMQVRMVGRSLFITYSPGSEGQELA
jgi:hypothetical protein